MLLFQQILPSVHQTQNCKQKSLKYEENRTKKKCSKVGQNVSKKLQRDLKKKTLSNESHNFISLSQFGIYHFMFGRLSFLVNASALSSVLRCSLSTSTAMN